MILHNDLENQSESNFVSYIDVPTGGNLIDFSSRDVELFSDGMELIEAEFEEEDWEEEDWEEES